MKIEVTWTKPDGTKAVMGAEGSGTDEQLEITKALAAAQAHFHQKSGAAPPVDQLSARVIENE